ncbi:hypothetical protein [Rhodocytophaga rosea]|nr:hypothetical protein [Rhodocytophaga rosea]
MKKTLVEQLDQINEYEHERVPDHTLKSNGSFWGCLPANIRQVPNL